MFGPALAALLMLASVGHSALAQSAGDNDSETSSQTDAAPADDVSSGQLVNVSEQPVTATRLGPVSANPLFGFSGLPTLPRDNTQNPQTYDLVPSPVGVPLFDQITPGSTAGDSNYYLVQMSIPAGAVLYAYNCSAGQCQGSAADVWAAMPGSQRQNYLSALLDVYEPIAETINRPVTNQGDGKGPSRHAQIWIQPSKDPMSVLDAAKIDVDPSGSLTKWYLGPNSVTDIAPQDRLVEQNGRRVRIPAQPVVDWTPYLPG